MEIKDVEKLKQWLLKRLEPLCDADPAALAKYVVALLRKEKPKSSLKELCIDQLEVFLAKETVIFVDNLFTVLESENYLKKEITQTPSPSPSPPPPPLTGNPGNSNGATTTTVHSPPRENSTARIVIDRRQSEDTPKNKEVDDEDRDFRRSRRTDTNYGNDTTSRRLITTSTLSQTRKAVSSVATTDPDRTRKRRSDQETVSSKMPRRGEGEVLGFVRRPVRERLGPKPDDRSDVRGRRSWRDRSRSPDSGSDSSTGGSSRKRPRASGGKYSDNRKSQRCKDYDEKGFCMLGEKCPYDHGIDPLVIGTVNPYTPALPLGLPPPLPPLNMPKPSMLLPPVVPPSLTGRVSPSSNTGTDGYNPEDPSLTSTSVSAPPSLIPPRIIPPPLPMRPSFPPPLHGVTIPPPPSLTTLPPRLMMPPTFRSTIPYPRPIRPPMKLTDTLVVRKVPRDVNSITKLSSHFEKFGTIVNLTVRYEGDPESALVQFSNPYEAKRAHDSTEAVLNNRFIRIYYLRKDSAGPIVIETTPGSVAVSTIHGPPAVPETQGPPPSFLSNHGDKEERSATEPPHSTPKPPPSIPDHATPPSTKPLASPTPPMVNTAGGQHRRQPQQKVEIAKKQLELQKRSQALLQKQIDQQKLLISKLEKTGKHLTTEEKAKIMETLKSISSNISKLKDTSAMKTPAVKTELKIPKELLEQHQPSTTTEGATSPVNALKQKAHALRMQAQKLGLIPNPSQPLPPAVGMGKSHQQPGGVDLRTKLESKPRQLLVINVEEKDQLTAYFESFGGLLQVEVVPDKPKNLIFTFRNHSSAQMVVKSGSVFNGRPLIMKWYSPKAAATTTLPSPTFSPASIQRQTSLEHQTTASITEEQVTTPTLVKPDPADLHLVDDDEEEESEGRSWRR